MTLGTEKPMVAASGLSGAEAAEFGIALTTETK
jgi:hypothetical protein